MFTKYFSLTFIVLLLSTSLVGCNTICYLTGIGCPKPPPPCDVQTSPPTWEDVEEEVNKARTDLFDVGGQDNPVGLSRFGRFLQKYQEPVLVMAKLANNTNFNIDVDKAFGIIKRAIDSTGSGIVSVELPYVSLKALRENDLGLYERILGDADRQTLEQRRPILALLSSIEQKTGRDLCSIWTPGKDDGKLQSTISLSMKLIDVQTVYRTSTGEYGAKPIWEFDGEISTFTLEGDFKLLVGNFVSLNPEYLSNDFTITHFHHSTNALGLIVVELTLDNKSYTEQNLYYKFTWYNQEGMSVLPDFSRKRPVKIPGNDSEYIKAVAPRADAVTFKLKISDR